MKPIALPAFLFFLLFAFLTSTDSAETVNDTAGVALRNGSTYYFLPVRGGVIEASDVEIGNSCRVAVVVNTGNTSTNGWALQILSSKAAVIDSNVPINISFASPPPEKLCTDSRKWIIAADNSSTEESVIVSSAAGVGPDFVNGSFYIKTTTVAKQYKLKFCDGKGQPCHNIGFRSDGKLTRLVVKDNAPLLFKLQEVRNTSDSDLLMVASTMNTAYY